MSIVKKTIEAHGDSEAVSALEEAAERSRWTRYIEKTSSFMESKARPVLESFVRDCAELGMVATCEVSTTEQISSLPRADYQLARIFVIPVPGSIDAIKTGTQPGDSGYRNVNVAFGSSIEFLTDKPNNLGYRISHLPHEIRIFYTPTSPTLISKFRPLFFQPKGSSKESLFPASPLVMNGAAPLEELLGKFLAESLATVKARGISTRNLVSDTEARAVEALYAAERANRTPGEIQRDEEFSKSMREIFSGPTFLERASRKISSIFS